jgi:hypothetical protein
MIGPISGAVYDYKNAEQRKAYMKEYIQKYRENPENRAKQIAAVKRWQQNNPERFKEGQQKYYDNMPDEKKEAFKQKKRVQAWWSYHFDPEYRNKKMAANREYYQKNTEKCKANSMEYYHKNPEVRETRKEYAKLRNKGGPENVFFVSCGIKQVHKFSN